MIPKSQDTEALGLQPTGSLGVVLPGVCLVVLAPVEFDDQSAIEANEIDDVVAEWDLPAEFEVLKTPITEACPDETLGLRQVATQLASTVTGKAHRSGMPGME